MYHFNWKAFSSLLDYHKCVSEKSLKELAERFQVSVQTVYGWKAGRHQPDLSQLGRIAEFFGIKTDDLIAKPEDFKLITDDILKGLNDETETGSEGY